MFTLLLLSSALADVTINEAMVDATGSDAGQHWVELFNDGAVPVDLDGWVLERAKSSWNLLIPLTGSIPPGGFYVVGEAQTPADYVVPLVDLGNGGATADAIRLRDPSGAIVDTLVYGGPNSDGWDDDVRSATTRIAPQPISGDTLARIVDGGDSDDSAADFRNGAPTPGATNSGPPTGTCDAAGTTLLINELFPNPSGVDAGWEWLELYNYGGQPLDLSGWVIEAGTSAYDTSGELPPGTVIDPGQHLVVGQSNISTGIVVPGWVMGNASNDADAVRILDCFGQVQDTVVYGYPNTDGWLDDEGGVANTAPRPDLFGNAGYLGRITDGVDSNDSFEDFERYRTGTPAAPNRLWFEVSRPYLAGGQITLTVRGALPGAWVYLGAQTGLGTAPCPALLGGLCLEISSPVLLGRARSGIDRTAELTLTIPATLPPGTLLRFQAATGPGDPAVSFVWQDYLSTPP